MMGICVEPRLLTCISPAIGLRIHVSELVAWASPPATSLHPVTHGSCLYNAGTFLEMTPGMWRSRLILDMAQKGTCSLCWLRG
ncbi:hypothetical protein AB1N83_012692 [Pleurotus pulmonarius]